MSNWGWGLQIRDRGIVEEIERKRDRETERRGKKRQAAEERIIVFKEVGKEGDSIKVIKRKKLRKEKEKKRDDQGGERTRKREKRGEREKEEEKHKERGGE